MNNFRPYYKTKFEKTTTETQNNSSNFKTKYIPIKHNRKNYFYRFLDKF